MLTDPQLRSKINTIWIKLHSGGLSNPLDSIEQLSYLIFLKRLDERETQRERLARLSGQSYTSALPDEMRWSVFTRMEAEPMLEHMRNKVFPWFKTLTDADSSFTRYMATAEFKINKSSLLVEACNLIGDLNISAQNQDVQGDLYEYLLSKLNTAGTNGQFRTPRHIIRMIVQIVDPKKHERVGDLAAGTCGFLVNAYGHILEANTSPDILEYDAAGEAHGAVGDRLTDEERAFLQKKALRGFDSDSGMAMLRIGSMNLMLHGLENPQFFYADSLSKNFTETRSFDVLLMNPPFKGAVDKGDVSATLPTGVKKTELLFIHLMLRALENGGRAGVIVPDGVLFGSSKAHVTLRKTLLEQHRLEGVVSMPGGVFKPYAGVSTAILLFTKGGRTDRVWYYDMAHDGLSLDDKRNPTPGQNDIPDILESWAHRADPAYSQQRQTRADELQTQLAPLKAEKLRHQALLNRLTFEQVIAPEGEDGPRAALDTAQRELAELEAQIAPLAPEYAQLRRQFWVSKEQIAAHKYDLSASRYRPREQDDVYHEPPQVTLERLKALERVMGREMDGLLRELEPGVLA
jgi:type I restriction enzyme M protein